MVFILGCLLHTDAFLCTLPLGIFSLFYVFCWFILFCSHSIPKYDVSFIKHSHMANSLRYVSWNCEAVNNPVKGIVHFEIKIWYLSAYPKGIQDVGVFFSSVDPILMFLGQTVLVCQSYNGRYRCPSL